MGTILIRQLAEMYPERKHDSMGYPKNEFPLPDIDAFGQPVQIRIAI
jgi:hypothetical protein